MQIALTKKLSEALKIKVPATDETINPLFTWTANWTNVWDNRKADNMLVLINNATRFTIAIYEVKRKDLKDIQKKMQEAIVNTMLALNYNPELVAKYMALAGEVKFVKNSNRYASAWVSKAGFECSIFVGREFNGIDKMYKDTLGLASNYRIVNISDKKTQGYYPYKAMIDKLVELTGMPAYKSSAMELMVTLDLEIYKATRRIIVPENMDFLSLHKTLQSIFNWNDYHLYDFVILDDETKKPIIRMVQTEEDLAYDDEAILMEGHSLSEIFPKYKQMIYTYDMGDNWEHEIQLIRMIEESNIELPYLLEASGKTPPEDVGGVDGFIDFRKIILNKEHPDHLNMTKWARYWQPELSEWERKKGAIHLY